MQGTEEKSSAGRLFVPSLAVAFFSTWIIEWSQFIFQKIPANFVKPQRREH